MAGAALPLVLGIGGAVAGTSILGKAVKRNLAPDINIPAQPKPPTIDEARRNTDELDRIRRRRGVLANIFAGSQSSATAPSVGTKQLLGQ